MNAVSVFATGCLLIVSVTLYASQAPTVSPQRNENGQAAVQADADAARAFQPPKITLQGNLAKIFTVTGCEYISGLTCRVHYNGKLPLPSQVFVTEFDDHGKQAGARVGLIYPELKSGETGRATFRIRSARPAKIILQAEWNGPWQDPY